MQHICASNYYYILIIIIIFVNKKKKENYFKFKSVCVCVFSVDFQNYSLHTNEQTKKKRKKEATIKK